MRKTIDIDTVLQRDKLQSVAPSPTCVANTISRIQTTAKYPLIIIPLSLISVATTLLIVATFIYFIQKLPFIYIGSIYCVYMFLGLCTALAYALGQDTNHKKGGAV